MGKCFDHKKLEIQVYVVRVWDVFKIYLYQSETRVWYVQVWDVWVNVCGVNG